MRNSTQTFKKKTHSRSLFDNGKMAVTLPHSRAFAIVWGFKGVTKPPATSATRHHISHGSTSTLFLGTSQNGDNFPSQNISKVTLTGDSFNPDWKVKLCFNVKGCVHSTITVLIGRPAFEERSPNSLAVCE